MFREQPGSPRMFKSDFLDFFSRVHWAAVPMVYVPLIVGAAVYSVGQVGWAATPLAFLVGLFAWTLLEYWLHRTVFHWVPQASWGAAFHFFLHGVHHDWPNDRFRLVMPPAASLALLAIVAPISLAVLGSWGWGFLAGLLVGYVNYDLTHYFIHHGRPRSRRMKRLKAHHMNHHFNKTETRFGVSTTIWDRVFGTL